jgi:hypothetical protein
LARAWNRRKYLAPFVAALSIGCEGGSPTAPSPPSATLQQLRVENRGSLQVGRTVEMRAVGEYSDGSTRDLTSQATWSSSNHDVATVTPDGRVTGHAAGAVTIRATHEGVEGALQAVVLGRGWQVRVIVQRLECLGDCEDFTQGQGDFAYSLELATENVTGQILAGTSNYPSSGSVVRLGTNESVNINRTGEFSTRDADGRLVDLTFRATEWDERLGSPVVDSRMNDESSTARYQYRANQDWLPNGPNYITIGSSSCRLRLHYTLLKE